MQILEKLEENGKKAGNAFDASITSRRKQIEKTCMLKLRIVYLYGLNDGLGDEYKKDNAHMLVGNKFPPPPVRHNRIFRGNSHKNNNSSPPDEFLIKIKHNLNHDLSDVPNFFRLAILAINIFNLNNSAILLQDNLSDASNSIYCQWYSIVLDIIESTIIKPPTLKFKKKETTNFCKSFLLNKCVEITNVLDIFREASVKTYLPIDIKSGDPAVDHTLNIQISSKIYNFNKYFHNLHVKAFLQDSSIFPCSCEFCDYINKNYQHIITSDLRIMKNNKLRKLSTKNPKYRENKNIS